MHNLRKSSATKTHRFEGKHRFEHWYRDNTVYFITARCRDRYPAFESEDAKRIFWDRFTHYANVAGFEPFVTSLLDNHYHTVGYLRRGAELGQMMRRLHGSTAKLVNDLLPERRLPFWREAGHQDYFDGCLRDEQQLRRTYRYVLTQSVRHGLARDWRLYAHTRVVVDLTTALELAGRRRVYLPSVPYARYQRPR